MRKVYKSTYELEGKREERRLLITAGILATAFSAIAVLPGGFWNLIKVTISLSGAFAFLYLIMTASNLKYSEKYRGNIGDFEFSERFRKFAYDQSIDTYGYNVFVLLVIAFQQLISSKTDLGDNWSFALGIAIASVLTFILLLLGVIAKRAKSKS